MCSSCKVVWETLGPGWEVFSREMEGERWKEKREACPFHFPPQQSEMIFNNVLFTPGSERTRERRREERRGRTGEKKEEKQKGRKRREINEEMRLKETYRQSARHSATSAF